MLKLDATRSGWDMRAYEQTTSCTYVTQSTTTTITVILFENMIEKQRRAVITIGSKSALLYFLIIDTSALQMNNANQFHVHCCVASTSSLPDAEAVNSTVKERNYKGIILCMSTPRLRLTHAISAIDHLRVTAHWRKLAEQMIRKYLSEKDAFPHLNRL